MQRGSSLLPPEEQIWHGLTLHSRSRGVLHSPEGRDLVPIKLRPEAQQRAHKERAQQTDKTTRAGDLLMSVELRLGALERKYGTLCRGGSAINGQPFRLPGESLGVNHAAAESDCAAQICAFINGCLVRYDTVPGLKHAYNTVPPRH